MLRIALALILALATPAIARQIQTTRTDDGIGVRFVTTPSAPTQTISLIWSHPMASRLDAQAASMALGVLLASGSDEYPPADAQIYREATGARAYVRTSPGAVILTLNAAPGDMPQFAKMVNAAITQLPADGDAWVSRWQLLATQGIRRAQLDLDAAINAVLAHLEYGDIDGRDLARDVQEFPRGTLMDLIHAQSNQRPVSVVAAGPALDPALRGAINAAVAGLTHPGPAWHPATPHPRIKARRVLVVDETIVEPEMLLLAQTGGRGDQMRVGLDMLARVMGAGLASRLSLAIRRELRASYDVSAESWNVPAGNQLFTIRGAIKPALLQDAIDRALTVYDDVRRNGITNEEGRAAQVRMFNGYAAAEANDSEAAATRLTDALTGAIRTGTEPLSRITRALQPADLAKVQDLLPPPEDVVIIVQSPDPDALPGACVVTRIAMIEDCL